MAEPVTTTGKLFPILEERTDGFKTGFAVLAVFGQQIAEFAGLREDAFGNSYSLERMLWPTCGGF